MRMLAQRVTILIGELKRRGVFKAVVAYAVVAWGASLAATDLLPTFGAPDWAARAFIICAALGVPIIALLAWICEVTTHGIVRDSSAPVNSASDDTTLMAATTGGVRMQWTDAAGAHEHTFFESFLIGRDEPCALRLDDPHISRQHAEIRFERGRWWALDLGSRNGTRLNGKLLRRAPLPPAGALQLYDAGPPLTFELGGSDATLTMVGHTVRE